MATDNIGVSYDDRCIIICHDVRHSFLALVSQESSHQTIPRRNLQPRAESLKEVLPTPLAPIPCIPRRVLPNLQPPPKTPVELLPPNIHPKIRHKTSVVIRFMPPSKTFHLPHCILRHNGPCLDIGSPLAFHQHQDSAPPRLRIRPLPQADRAP